jgi:hypothetical protein
MDLVERYLHAVGFWLPRAVKRDINAELSEDIQSQIDERERELGRPLGEAEVGALLKQRGSPFIVANRYLPQEQLIGPTLFPIYRFVLKIVAACWLLPWALVWIGFLTFDRGFRATHGGDSWLRTLGAFWSNFWAVAFVAVGAVTVVFAALERTQAGQRLLVNWDPHKLPAVADPNKIPRGNSVIELAGSIVFCAWWVAALSSPVVLDGPGLRLVLAPAWPSFYWGYLALSVANIALAGTNLVQPRWTRRRAGVRLASDLAGSALFCVLCLSNIVAEIGSASMAPARAQDLTHAINMWMARAVPVVVAVALVVLAFDVYRLVRVKAEPSRSAATTDRWRG